MQVQYTLLEVPAHSKCINRKSSLNFCCRKEFYLEKVLLSSINVKATRKTKKNCKNPLNNVCKSCIEDCIKWKTRISPGQENI